MRTLILLATVALFAAVAGLEAKLNGKDGRVMLWHIAIGAVLGGVFWYLVKDVISTELRRRGMI